MPATKPALIQHFITPVRFPSNKKKSIKIRILFTWRTSHQNVIKVGISQEERGIRRLLEQGARLAIKLETFSSALIARQYEAKISKLDGIVETLPVHKKMELIKQPFDRATGERELRQKLLEIEQKIGVSFPKSELIPCEDYFKPLVLICHVPF